MTTWQLFYSSLFHFKKLKDAKQTPFWKAILYTLFLSALLSIPIAFKVFGVMQDIQQDGQAIAAEIPDFTIKEGRLSTDAQVEGFIYQTDSIIFTFDPTGKREPNDISNDLIGNFLSVGLLEKELVLSLPNTGGVMTALFGNDQFNIPYTNEVLQNLSGENLRTSLDSSHIPWWIQVIAFLVSLYPAFISLVVTLFFATIGANLYAKLKLYTVTFFETLKTMIYCATLPVILSALIYVFSPSFDSSLLITFISLFIFTQAAKGFPKQEMPPLR
ncbi:hypothetical protein BAU15_06765 [Enterococcus sp. JM4C]|uniref:DUF1189 domain-containing protein n=1 Tax=Candidatus Enterococcus huntleyi TaxID=1857217 RepID=UPI0013797A74|nr:DUF1189 domain-containing protein [Enterococcus sp. JM4C]KAF1297244.1 hypothetical protein BAU15_06765 [Enterococcus sp. JM4C]